MSVLSRVLPVFIIPGALAAQEEPLTPSRVSPRMPVADARRTDDPPTLDGRLDDPVWARVAPIAGFVQHEPFEGRAATERTEVRIVFDDVAVYVGAWLYDSDPASIVAGETRRDVNLQNMDAFLIVFDTYLDRQNAFVFGTTPAGLEYDGQVTKEGEGGSGGSLAGRRQQGGSGGGLNLNWDGSWEVATSVDARGWYAEFRIPFSTLRYGDASGNGWGMNLARYVRRRNEQDFWAPVPRQHTLYRVSEAGTLLGIDPPAKRVLSVTPYALGTARRDFVTGAETDFSGEVGGDAKIGLTPSLTLDLTVNTDFAQVEVDEQQVNLTRFSLFFPEKRPFFLENAGTFSVGTPRSVELLFSRRIGISQDGNAVPIRGGARVSGKVRGFTVGMLDVQTEGNDSTVAETNFSAVRVIRELPNRSRVGATFASRLNTNQTSDYNLTYALDGQLGIGDALTFDGYAARTETPGLVGASHAVSVGGSLSTRDWSAGLSYREVAEDFNPEVGFLPRNSYRFVRAHLLRRIRTPNVPWFRELRPHITTQQFFDLDGFTESRLVHIDSHFEFANGAFFQLPAVNFTREGLKEPFEISEGIFVPPGTYDNVSWGFAYNTNLSSPVSLQGRITIGGFYSGHRKSASGTVGTRLGSVLAAALRFDVSDVELAEGSFETALVGLRLSYAFTPRIYVQSLIQYNNQTDEASGNFRFAWLGTAGTGLFVVFNDARRVGAASGLLDRAVVVKFTRQFNLAE